MCESKLTMQLHCWRMRQSRRKRPTTTATDVDPELKSAKVCLPLTIAQATPTLGR